MSKILLVEDEESIRRLISYDLKMAKYDFVLCEDGKQALEQGLNEKFDLMIIDWMLPFYSGLELVKKLRAAGVGSIMIMLTAKDEEEDILDAFDAGVDDYIAKPFSPRELMARIQAHLKRIPSNEDKLLTLGDLTMDLKRREIGIQDKVIDLTKKEFELLEYLMRNQRIVLSRDTILNEIWDFDYDGDTRIVDVHIFKLRAKLVNSKVNIRSMRGIGYLLEEEK